MSDLSCSTWLKSSTRPWLFSCVSSAAMRSSSCRWTWARRWFVASMRLRASSSSNSARAPERDERHSASDARAQRNGGAHAAASAGHGRDALSPRSRWRRALGPCSHALARSLTRRRDDVDAAILGPRRLVVTFAARLFLAEAHRLDLGFAARRAAPSAASPRRRAAARARCCIRACRARRCCPAASSVRERFACRYLRVRLDRAAGTRP